MSGVRADGGDASSGPGGQAVVPARRALAVVDAGRRWWRPGLQVPGLLLWGSSMLLGYSVQNPRHPAAWDTSVLVALIPSRTPFVVSASQFIEFWDGPQATPYLIVAAGVLVFLRGHRTLGIIASLMTGLAWLPGHIAKSLFPRDRPGPDTQPVWEVLGPNSFPSGHTGLVIAATVTAMFVMSALGHRRGRIVVAVVGLVWMVVVGLSRLVVAVHFPTDVVGGIGLDGGMALILWPVAAGVNHVLPRRVPALADRRAP